MSTKIIYAKKQGNLWSCQVQSGQNIWNADFTDLEYRKRILFEKLETKLTVNEMKELNLIISEERQDAANGLSF